MTKEVEIENEDSDKPTRVVEGFYKNETANKKNQCQTYGMGSRRLLEICGKETRTQRDDKENDLSYNVLPALNSIDSQAWLLR